MSSKAQLRRAVCETIDRHADAIIDLGETILRHPETGFNEVKTAALVAEHMAALGLAPRTGLALTGVKGRLAVAEPGPRRAFFDDVDMAMMIHTGSRDGGGTRAFLAKSSNGALVKRIRFVGRAAHAGSLPQLGINALNAAMIAMSAISAQRETFWEKDTIRIHPIITKGGDAVSVVPAEVTMETFVRGGSLEAIVDANKKVDRCLRAGAMAMGAEVEIHTIPGYLPQRNDERLGQIFGANVESLFGPGEFHIGGHRTGSTDM